MISKQIILNPKITLNVKTIKKIVSLTSNYASNVYIEYDGRCVKIESIMEVALMEVQGKASLALKTKGKDAFKALFEIGDMLEKGIDTKEFQEIYN